MKYQGLWAHFWSLAGFSSLLRHFLATSSAQLRLGRVHRVVNADDSVELWATERSREVLCGNREIQGEIQGEIQEIKRELRQREEVLQVLGRSEHQRNHWEQ